MSASAAPADTRELPGLTITKVAVGSMNNNAYLLRCTATGELALIDAANEADTLLALVGDVPLATVITTHQHWDHWGALKEVQEATGAQTVAHPEDAEPLPVPVSSPGAAWRRDCGGERDAIRYSSTGSHAREHCPAL